MSQHNAPKWNRLHFNRKRPILVAHSGILLSCTHCGQNIMRGLKVLRGLASLTSSTLIEGLETATRALSTAPDLKSVLKEKIPAQQVCIPGVLVATPAAGQQNAFSMSLVDLCVHCVWEGQWLQLMCIVMLFAQHHQRHI